MDKLVTINKYNDIFEAELAKGLLADNGIEAFLQNERLMSISPALATGKITVELQVWDNDAETARQIIDGVMQRDDVAQILRNEDAMLEGHFLLTSGKHSNMYVEKIRLLQNPAATSKLCEKLCYLLDEYDFDCVVGPAYGGIVLAFEVARQLGKPFLFCQRKDGEMTIRSGFDLSEIKRVAIIEDIVTTGGSVFEVVKCLTGRGVEIAVIAALVDRGGGLVDFGYPFRSLLQLVIPTWEADDCELCKEDVVLVKPGSSDKIRLN
ncbi:MAG: orotate phosphoribosyltransferase [Candidatus Cloacimonadaceae bacterium]|nr:orotate phosphoribosyltransferase [Candidatus Cloacimonadaceae bacterium]